MFIIVAIVSKRYLSIIMILNPIKLIDKNWKEYGIKDFKEAKQFLQGYKWSSYLDYKGIIRSENKILDINNFPKYFQNTKDFDMEIIEWLKFFEEDDEVYLP